MMNETTGNVDNDGHEDDKALDQDYETGSGQTGYTDPVLSKLDEVVMCLTKISVSLERIARVYTQPREDREADIALANAPALKLKSVKKKPPYKGTLKSLRMKAAKKK